MNEDHQSSAILKELSDIKASLAVNTSETQNIKSNISEIKGDIKEIKNDFVSRRELKEAIKMVNDEINPLRKAIYGFVTLIVVAVIGAVIKLVVK